jgi:hypothetical protein
VHTRAQGKTLLLILPYRRHNPIIYVISYFIKIYIYNFFLKKILYNFYKCYESILGVVIKIGLRCNFFCVGAGLSKKFAEDKKTAVLLNTHSTVYAELNFTKTLHDISII